MAGQNSCNADTPYRTGVRRRASSSTAASCTPTVTSARAAVAIPAPRRALQWYKPLLPVAEQASCRRCGSFPGGVYLKNTCVCVMNSQTRHKI